MNSAASLPVLLVGNFLSARGGSRSICEELAARLPDAGCPVVTTSSKEARWLRLLDMVTTTWRRRHQYEVAQIDVFSGPAFFWAEAVCAALTLAGKPFILTLHGGNLPHFVSQHPERVRRLLRSAAAVTTPSRYLLERFALYRDDIRFIPNGLDVDAYAPRARVAARPRLVWLRAFHRIYNPSLAIRTLALLLPDWPDTHLTMVGPDKGDGSRQAVERLASELGVSPHLTLVGGIPKRDVPALLSQADIFLNTTNVDNAPVSVIEAMATGLCIVTTDVDGIPFLVDNERDALLVPPDNPQAMADAVGRVLEHDRLAARLSQNALRKAERLDWSWIISEWRRLLAATAERAA